MYMTDFTFYWVFMNFNVSIIFFTVNKFEITIQSLFFNKIIIVASFTFKIFWLKAHCFPKWFFLNFNWDIFYLYFCIYMSFENMINNIIHSSKLFTTFDRSTYWILGCFTLSNCKVALMHIIFISELYLTFTL